jgi:hypothetical protein
MGLLRPLQANIGKRFLGLEVTSAGGSNVIREISFQCKKGLIKLVII